MSLIFNEPYRIEGRIDLKPEREGYLYRAYISTWQEYEGLAIGIHIEFDEFRVTAATPKGVWISHPRVFYSEDLKKEYAKWKWVSNTSRKRYAYPTKKEAMNSLLMRKYRHIAILRSKVKDFEIGIRMLERELGLEGKA